MGFFNNFFVQFATSIICWVVISGFIVIIAISEPDIIFRYLFHDLHLIKDGINYTDVVGWCLTSLFSTALVSFGAAEIIKVYEEKNTSKNSLDEKKTEIDTTFKLAE